MSGEARTAPATGYLLALRALWLVPPLGQLVKHAGTGGAFALTLVAFLGLKGLLLAAH